MMIFPVFLIALVLSCSYVVADNNLYLSPTAGQVNDFVRFSDINNNTMFKLDSGLNLVVNPLAIYQHGIRLGNGTNHGVNTMIESDRQYTGTQNAHAFGDYNIFFPSVGGNAADSFDSQLSDNGVNAIDHLRAYQSRLIHNAAGTLGEMSGFGVFSNTQNGGLVTNVKEFGGVDSVGTGTITNQYGFYMPSLLKGLNNWAFFSNLGKVHIGDNTDISGTLTVNNQTTVAGLHVAITGEQTTNYTPSTKDDVIVMNVTSGNKKVNLPTAVGASGKIYTIKMVGLTAGNIVQVLPLAGQTINGFSKGYNMTHADEIMVVQSNNTAWNKISNSDTSSSNYYQNRGTTRWVDGVVASGGTTTSLLFASQIYAIPFVVPATEQFDREAIEVSTAANPTTNDCRVAIYTDNGNTYPDQLVPNSDSGTNNNIQAVRIYNFSSPITLSAGLYWKALACNTAATTMPTLRAQSTGLLPIIGYTRAGGLSQESVLYLKTGYTYGPMLQTFPAGGVATVVNTFAPPLIFLEMNKG